MKTKSNSGSTIIAVIALLTVLSAFVIAALSYTSTISYNVMSTNVLRQATEVGDGTLQYMFAYWRELCKEAPGSARPTHDFAGIPAPTQSLFPSISNFTASTGANPSTGTPYTVANCLVQATDPQGNIVTGTTAPTPSEGMNENQKTTYYVASADVTMPTYTGHQIKLKLRENFQKQTTSPWQYAIFYNDLLEINPGAPMSVAGWVHTNNNLYTAYSNLTFLNKVDYVDDWGAGSTTAANAKGFAPGDADPAHTVSGESAPNYPTNLPPTRGDTQLPFGFDPSQVFITSGTGANDNNTGYHELIEPPDTSNPDPVSQYRYYDNALVRIMIGTGNAMTISDSSGQVISPTTYNNGNNSFTSTQTALYNLFFGNNGNNSPVATGQSLQDNREGGAMNITTLDISKVTAAMTATGSTRGGVTGNGVLQSAGVVQGVIYIANSTGSSSVKTGVELINGASAPLYGLTVVSENPVYIQGDFNTGQTASSKTPANTANNGTGNNVVSGYTEAPCSILADAINVLSNSWTNSGSTNALASRVASPTTINAAFVTGIVPTGSPGASGANSYSGGAENFPRFLEHWTNQTFTYYGSMVELYNSQQSTGFWGSSNVYDPPVRNWHFDTLFLTNPPPGTFNVFNYAKGRWYVTQ